LGLLKIRIFLKKGLDRVIDKLPVVQITRGRSRDVLKVQRVD
jgi:hypothetical protein